MLEVEEVNMGGKKKNMRERTLVTENYVKQLAIGYRLRNPNTRSNTQMKSKSQPPGYLFLYIFCYNLLNLIDSIISPHILENH